MLAEQIWRQFPELQRNVVKKKQYIFSTFQKSGTKVPKDHKEKHIMVVN